MVYESTSAVVVTRAAERAGGEGGGGGKDSMHKMGLKILHIHSRCGN